jgi:hypothetical protein
MAPLRKKVKITTSIELQLFAESGGSVCHRFKHSVDIWFLRYVYCLVHPLLSYDSMGKQPA